tara:strand:+ start:504 stop:683 length:180 start_codon:yes stop_codon:yes gene_type:complete
MHNRRNKNIIMKLGDLVYKITYFTGIHWMVKKISKLIGRDCGCEKRREDWNNIKISRNG